MPNVNDFFLEISDDLGVPIADENLVGPVRVRTILGLEIDEMMVRIPQSKINALVAELKKFSKENKAIRIVSERLTDILMICQSRQRSLIILLS